MNYTALKMPEAGDTVVVGMSGGVDSTLTAFMLKEKGCRVIGATMALWDNSLPELEKDGREIKDACYSPHEKDDIAECEKFCKEHGIEYHVVRVEDEYKKNVIEYFKSEYRNGRTPNPCIQCNRYIKFGALLSGLEKIGIEYDFFCTGHYAKIVRPDDEIWNSGKRPAMIAGALDVSKDQTYFLCRIPSETLEKVRFPLASMKKSEVFELARRAGLKAAEKKESQDFIGEEYFDLLFADKPSVPGDIIDLDGHVLGRHHGIEHYTVGQRKGLGIAMSYPVYVHSIDAKNNVVVLAPNSALSSRALVADDFIWPAGAPEGKISVMVKIRLASKPVEADVERYVPSAGDSFKYKGVPYLITFKEPQRAVAPGQSAVLYIDGVIHGCGYIAKPVR